MEAGPVRGCRCAAVERQACHGLCPRRHCRAVRRHRAARKQHTLGLQGVAGLACGVELGVQLVHAEAQLADAHHGCRLLRRQLRRQILHHPLFDMQLGSHHLHLVPRRRQRLARCRCGGSQLLAGRSARQTAVGLQRRDLRSHVAAMMYKPA